jgi:predicted ATPase
MRDLVNSTMLRRCIGEAMAASEATGESWCDADIHRLAGDIVVLSGELDMAKAEAYFERALTVARGQQAKSFELRAASALARLWRDQGKRGEARDLLAQVYGWFTEGFDTLTSACQESCSMSWLLECQVSTISGASASSPACQLRRR